MIMNIKPLSLAVSALLLSATASADNTQPELSQREVRELTVDGLQFKDLNHSGKLEPYENWRLTTPMRAAELIKRMTLEEKASVMMHCPAPTDNSPICEGKNYYITATKKMIDDQKVNSL